MARQVTHPGRLIAIDGSRGKDTNASADVVVDTLRAAGIECAVSRFDASGLFGELAAGRGDRNLSMRTLALVYAADLAFRLRWEIRPVLESGGIVIAAPYVETAIGFGVTNGLREDWLRELFRFAPAPQWRGCAGERKIGKSWKLRLDRGYPEYCAAMLEANEPGCVSASARRKMIAHLRAPRGRAFDVSEEGLRGLVQTVTGSRRAATRRTPARPRTARK